MNPPSRRVQWLVWGGLGLVVAGILAAFVLQRSQGRGALDSAAAKLPVLFPVPAFTLTNQAGQAVGSADLRGHPWLVDIIFTRCEGPCPVMTRRLAELQESLFPQTDLRLVTLTTDPGHDTPSVLRAYARRFGAQAGRWHFLTGTKQQISAVAVQGLKLTALDKAAAQQENPADLFIHSTILVLVDGRARVRAVFESDDPELKTKVTRALATLARESGPIHLALLPPLNATLNGLSALCLLAGRMFIRRERRGAHRNCMLGAVAASAVFLASYLYYHAHVGTTYFREPNWFRPIYVVLLYTHMVLAATIVPMVIVTLSRALRERFDQHKRIARWTWPMWMYVSVTGVLIYFLLYHIFPQTK